MAAPKQNKLFGPAKLSKHKKRTDSGPGGGADQDWEPGYVPKPKAKPEKKSTPMEKYHKKRTKKMMGM